MSSKELAKLLGVSESAVSLALNGKPGIGSETRKTILEAAEKYGIRRKAVSVARPKFINLVIFKKHGLVYGETPFFSAVLEGISLEVSSTPYNLQISYFYGSQDYDEQLRVLENAECEGIILLATEMTPDDIDYFGKLSKPCVLLDSHSASSAFSSVVINNHQGAFLATQHLIENGHKVIGHLASSVHIQNFSERRDGVENAFNVHSGTELITVEVESTQEGAYRDMMAYLSKKPKLPTAFFADNDIIAVSCIRALKENGYRIPQDVSIVGFDDMPMAYVTSPKLTTVYVPKEALGRFAVHTLMQEMAGTLPAPAVIAVNTDLVVRDSVKHM